MEIINTADENSIRLNFLHKTIYNYSGPVSFSPHRLVLRPRESHYQRIESMKITTQPESRLNWFEDIYGNVIARAEFDDHADELVITSEFTLLKNLPPTWAQNPERDGEMYPAYFPGIEESASGHYRRSVYPPEVEAIRQWVFDQSILPASGQSAPIFATMAAAIDRQISYKRREESGVQSPLKTLSLGSGSCRDTAVLMMEAGRSIGFATRFVSGYLESPNSEVGRGSTHAWMEVYLPDRGWAGFDPSIGKPVEMGHVAVAVSHHPRGVMPVSGKFDSQGFKSLGLKVEIQSSRITG